MSQNSAIFYDRLFATLDYALPFVKTGHNGYPKDAMLNASIVKMYEGFDITRLLSS